MRVIGGVAIGEDTQPPPREDVRLHDAPACRPTALLVEDAHPHAVAGVRDDGRYRPLLAVDAERQLARLVQPELLDEPAAQLGRLTSQPDGSGAVTPSFE